MAPLIKPCGILARGASGPTLLLDLDFTVLDTPPTAPALTAYTRASYAYPETSYEAGFGLRTSAYANNVMAFGYNANFSHASKVGALIEAAATNLCTYSEQFDHANWGKTNITVTANAEESPDGATTADKLAATAANGTIESAAMTVTSAADYTASVYIKRSAGMGGDVTGRLIHYDATGAAEETAVAFTATDEWQRISVRDASAASTSRTIRIEIDTDTEEVVVWGAQLEADYLTSYIPTTSSAATRAATAASLTNTGGNTYLASPQGEIEAVFARTDDVTETTANYLLEGFGGSSADRLQLYHNTSRRPRVTHRDSSGSAQINQNWTAWADMTAENTLRYRWDSTSTLPGHIENFDLWRNGVREAGATKTWTGGTGATTLYVGGNLSGALQIGGPAARIRIWDGPRADTP